MIIESAIVKFRSQHSCVIDREEPTISFVPSDFGWNDRDLEIVTRLFCLDQRLWNVKYPLSKVREIVALVK